MATDSGWSWVIAAACFWVTFVIQGLVRCSGVVFVAIIDAYEVSRAQASWPITLRMAVWNLSGPLAGALSYRWSIRAITFVGVLLVTLTNIVCWFASDIYIVTFFLGGMQGLGVGLAVTLIPVIINQYFSKYKSTGAGIACAGATAGSFALSPIVEFAVEEYALGGAFLMMAGITLHGILGAALMRPASWLKTSNKRPIEDQNLNSLKTKNFDKSHTEEDKCLLNNGNSRCHENDSRVSKPAKTVRFAYNGDKNMDNEAENEGTSLIENTSEPIVIKKIGKKTSDSLSMPQLLDDSDNNNSDFNDDSRTLVLNTNYVHIIEPLPPKYQSLSQIPTENETEQSFASTKLQFTDNESNYDPQINLKTVHAKYSSNEYSTSVDSNMVYYPTTVPRPCKFQAVLEPIKAACEILKNPMFLIIASNYSVFFLSYMTYLIVIVDYSLDLGVDRTDSVFLVSTFSVADLCGRLGSGWITDSGIVKRKHLMMVNMVTVGGLLVATSFTTTYAAVTGVSACAGLIVGINLILFYALLEEYLGLKKLPMAIGLMNFSIGVISLVTPLLTGYFRDTMGSYDHLFHLLGAVSTFCGLLWVLEPMYVACNRKEEPPQKSIKC